jgi:hypothetical protein
MIKKFHCSIIPDLSNNYLSFFSKEMIDHNLKRDRILNKWFYFYMNNPIQPIVIWIGKNGIRLEPGTNRYVGVALRQSSCSIPAIAIVEDDAAIPDFITILDCIESSNLEFDISGALDSNSKLCKWAIGTATTLNSFKWYIPAFKWIRKKLKYTWVLEYQGKKYFLNQHRQFFIFSPKIKKVVKVEDYKNFEDSVIDLFNQVCEYEGLK